MAKYSFLNVMRAQRAPVPPVLKADLSSQTVIVTGANVGIGFETAAHFARMMPGKLIIACRNKDAGEVSLSGMHDNRSLHCLNNVILASQSSNYRRDTTISSYGLLT